MIFGKHTAIKKYLSGKSVFSTFDLLLKMSLDKELKNALSLLGFNHITVHIDWLHTYRCIVVQAKYSDFYITYHFEPEEFIFAFSEDEAEDDVCRDYTQYSSVTDVFQKTVLLLPK